MAKSIMIQGTMSNAGKSLIAAGLCRIFKQDGYRVAPFKSQNMALNSFITRDSLEMGRAQAVQAEAAGIEPDVGMNPILLKPTTDMGSQVIINGRPVGNMRAMDYFKKKKEYIPVIREAYNRLASENDIIVIEGAGSPAEINLNKDDIVNMGMAKLADAPVLLVGDIDRGGVFAQLIGTVELLAEEEQKRIKGLIINKFRGDKEILRPGLDMIYEKCHKRVLGVVPFSNVDIEEEDSLAESLHKKEIAKGIDIAVIRLPRIANFTDFQALSFSPQVSLRYVDNVSQLKKPDMVILPGTKSTMKDLRWLRQCGLEAAIRKLAGEGTLLFGICGGYQMLGEKIEDPDGVEGEGTLTGMGLLPVVTCFEKEKARCRAEGQIAELSGKWQSLSGKKVSGYEIHMGRSHFTENTASGFMQLNRGENNHTGKVEGCVSGNVMGTYLHGIFDEEDFREAFLELIGREKGIDVGKMQTISYREYRQKQYDCLAAVLRESLDMDAVYRILWEGA